MPTHRQALSLSSPPVVSAVHGVPFFCCFPRVASVRFFIPLQSLCLPCISRPLRLLLFFSMVHSHALPLVRLLSPFTVRQPPNPLSFLYQSFMWLIFSHFQSLFCVFMNIATVRLPSSLLQAASPLVPLPPLYQSSI